MSITRKLAKTSLIAGVAAVALLAGPPQFSGSSTQPIEFGSTAEAQARISIGIFFDRLAPHGRWVRHRAHGYVFVPTGVGRNWRPYTVGRWVYTDRYGWYWVSDEPFGWATYRYGRWGYHPAYGWYWVPGNVWAPAWVTWRVGGGHIGWAPLAPDRRGYAWGVPVTYRPPIAESWVFVETRYVTAPTIVDYVVPIGQIPVVLAQATQRVDVRIEQNIVINQPVQITEIAAVAEVPIQEVELTVVDDPDQAVMAEGRVAVFQAEIEETQEVAAVPPDAAESPEEVADAPILEETLPPEAADEADAPTAAQVTEEPALEGELPADEPADEPAPTEPAAPVDPVEPVEPGEAVAPDEAVEPGEAVEPVEPVEPAERAEPTEPVAPAEPTPPVEEPADEPAPPPVEEPAEEPVAPAEPTPPVDEPTEEPEPAPAEEPTEEPAPPVAEECPPDAEEC